ncbi:MAG TPA: lysophospholipid acyltransferase family protein, partial [Candidatus Polarisedimenticolia bacterium]|nr:lysophospholipid acyltransferase family protein [Candidatus Polarisedimenticolia bacterium]
DDDGRHTGERYPGRSMFYWFVKGIFYPFVRLYLGLTRDGLEHLPRRGPAIVVSNHVSYIDPILLGSAAPRPVHFIVLQWMFDLFLLRWFYWGMGTIPVRSEGQDSKGVKRALKLLAAGRVLGIFPEGTRSADGRLLEPRLGAAMIAALSGAPVVPAYIDGARDSMPVGSAFPAPARVHVRFGPPLRFDREAGRDRPALREFALRMLEAIRRLEPAA